MNLLNSCQPDESSIFSAKNIRKCERYVRSVQRKLDKAVAQEDRTNIRWYTHILSKRSRATKILAVNRVTKLNHGKVTAGVDGEKLPEKEQDKWRQRLLEEINVEKKPEPIRRVYIPKPNSKKRPLGIPTIRDRIAQDIIRQAIEPITEYHYNHCSYGFRPKRNCHDAQKTVFTKLSGKYGKRWVIEGDIKGCFDHINHDHIIKTMASWNIPEWIQNQTRGMLKAKIFYDGEGFPTEEGTPQGGIISPMLANIALTAFDNYCQENLGWKGWTKEIGVYQVTPMVRYADDFIIVCTTKNEADKVKEGIKKFLKKNIGLELSEEKTLTTHLNKGFNFLGFNFRRYKETDKFYGKKKEKPQQKLLKNMTAKHRWENHKLLTKPTKEKVIGFLKECKRVIKENKTAPQKVLIKKLNEKLRGWGNYYRHVCSSQTFGKIDYEMWWKVYRWAKRKHPNKTKSWIMKKYFHQIKGYKNRFQDSESQETMVIMSQIPTSEKWIKISSEHRVYEGGKEAIKYWQNREYQNGNKAIFGSKDMAELYKKQKGKCPYCDKPLTAEAIQKVEVHKHHVKPRSQGGDWKPRNLRLLHAECHRELHGKLSREDMARLNDLGINYIGLLKKSS